MAKKTITLQVEQEVVDWFRDTGIDPSEWAESLLRQHLARLDGEAVALGRETDVD